ncbi:MAG: helix-turn-helix domain-containing protein [Muribaculaceae bacterium]
MKQDITFAGINIFNSNQQTAGMVLCTAGSREVLANGVLFKIEKGVLCFLSPIISIFELSRSEDYAELSIMDEIDNLYKVIRSIYDVVLKLRLRESPCIKLDEEYFNLFLNRRNEIIKKSDYLETVTDTGERKVLIQSIILLKQETLLEFIHLYYKNCEVLPSTVDKYDSLVFRFVYSLNQNYRVHRNVAFYAAELSMSKSHFTRIVKAKTGKTPSELIATITTVNAKLMLKQTDLSIKDIAAKLNFPEQFTFRKFFKHNTGCSPKEFRAKSKGKLKQ